MADRAKQRQEGAPPLLESLVRACAGVGFHTAAQPPSEGLLSKGVPAGRRSHRLKEPVLDMGAAEPRQQRTRLQLVHWTCRHPEDRAHNPRSPTRSTGKLLTLDGLGVPTVTEQNRTLRAALGTA